MLADLGFEMVLEHEVHGFGLQDAHAVEFAAIHHHAAEALVVFGAGAQTLAAHEQRGFLRELASVASALQHAGLGLRVDLADAGGVLGMHPEVGAGHFQRAEDALLHHFIERLARHGLDVAAQHVDAVSVLPAGAGMKLERLLGERFGERLQAGAAGGVGCCRESAGDVAVIQAAAVAHQHARRDGELRRHELAVLQHLRLGPFGAVLGNRLVEREQARIVERHRTGADDGLAHALQAEERVLRQRLLRLDVLPAKGLEVTALTVVMNEADDAGDFLVRHSFLQGDVELGQHLRLQSGLGGFFAVRSRFEIGGGGWRCRCRGRVWRRRSRLAEGFDLRRLLC